MCLKQGKLIGLHPIHHSETREHEGKIGNLKSYQKREDKIYQKEWQLDQQYSFQQGFPGGSDGKESACNVGDPGLIPGSGRSPGEGHGYTFQYSCLENSVNRGDWWSTVHGVTKNQT